MYMRSSVYDFICDIVVALVAGVVCRWVVLILRIVSRPYRVSVFEERLGVIGVIWVIGVISTLQCGRANVRG